MEQEEKLCDGAEKARELTYHGDRVSADGGCETAVTVRTKCGWAKSRKSGELLNDRRYPLRLKWAVYESYLRSTTLYGSEAWYLMESEM